MAKGRVLLAAPPGDTLADRFMALARGADYEVAIVAADISGTPMPISLTPVVAGVDLWRAGNDERYEAIAMLDERVPPARPLLTLCNAVSVDEIASYTVHAERVVGVSIFGPRRERMLVELVPGLGTESGAVRRGAEFIETLGLATERLPAGSWPILPRVVAMIVNEAAVAIADGVATASDIDTAMRLGANYPQGPLTLADEIGLHEIVAILDGLHAEYGDDRYRVAPLLRRMVLAGYTGKAVGRGFHLYP